MEPIKLKKYERQNIRRRLNCNPTEYIQAFERQKGVCEMCQQPSKHFLQPDRFRKRGSLKLLCGFCLRLSELRTKNPSVLTDRMQAYLETGPYQT